MILKTQLSPVDAMQYLLTTEIKELEQSYDRMKITIGNLFDKFVHSGVYLFIDRIDQALEQYTKELWISMQVGLLEASWNFMRNNHHIKIYTSVRLEAYSNYNSKNKMALRGSLTFLKYSKEDLLELLNRLSHYYLGVENFYKYIGMKEMIHPYTGHKYNVFDYILNHTISRPRELVVISHDYKKSGIKKNEVLSFRKKINTIASSEICPKIFSEYSLFLDSLRDADSRKDFLSRINRNVLTYKELKFICGRYNNQKDCEDKNCHNCNESHPFCELFNIGLIGTISKEDECEDSDEIQEFLQPHNLKIDSEGYLPRSSSYYLIHPCLNQIIKQERNRIHSKEYRQVFFVNIGNEAQWFDYYNRCLELSFALENLNEEKNYKLLRNELIKVIKSGPKEERAIKEAVKNIIDLVPTITDKATKVADWSIKVYEIINKIKPLFSAEIP